MSYPGIFDGPTRPAVVKNTFLEFPAEQDEGGEDPWLLSTLDTRRQQTDSLLERSRLRSDLERSIVASLRSNLSTPSTASASAAGLLTSSSGLSSSSTPLRSDGLWLPTPLPEAGKLPTWGARQRSNETVTEPEPLPVAYDVAYAGALGLDDDDDEQSSDGEAPLEGLPMPSNLLVPQTGAQGAPRPDVPPGTLPEGLKGCTTVMLRNVPCKYTQRKLMREINGAGFLGRFDFLYLPMDPRRRANRGFAFLNLESETAVAEFYHTFQDRRLANYTAEKDLEVAPAEIQGFEANAEHYLSVKATRKSRDMQSQPLFLRSAGNAGRGGKGAGVAAGPEATRGKGGAAARREAMQQQAAPWQQAPQRGLAAVRGPQVWQAPQAMQQAPTQMVVRFCPHCGQKKLPEHRFCAYCGKRVPMPDEIDMGFAPPQTAASSSYSGFGPIPV